MAALNGYLDILPTDPSCIEQNPKQLAARMLELYRGHFLSGNDVSWAILPREVLHGRFIKAMLQVAGMLSQAGEPQAALEYYYRLLELEPLREELHVAIMRCHIGCRQIASAKAVYQQLCKLLQSQSGAEPSAETRELYHSLLS